MDRLTDRPYMTIAVYRGRKTTPQQLWFVMRLDAFIKKLNKQFYIHNRTTLQDGDSYSSDGSKGCS